MKPPLNKSRVESTRRDQRILERRQNKDWGEEPRYLSGGTNKVRYAWERAREMERRKQLMVDAITLKLLDEHCRGNVNGIQRRNRYIVAGHHDWQVDTWTRETVCVECGEVKKV